jgi:peptidoglycan/LPS O-acetylase OafA/YrhL
MVCFYPIYLIAMLITILLFREELSSILGTIVFLQNCLVDNLMKNKPLWSLNHEMVYYLAGVPLLFYKIRPLYAVTFLSILLSIGYGSIHWQPY